MDLVPKLLERNLSLGRGEPVGSGAFITEFHLQKYPHPQWWQRNKAVWCYMNCTWERNKGSMMCVFLYSPKIPFPQWNGRAKEEKSKCFMLSCAQGKWCEMKSAGCSVGARGMRISSRHLRSCLGKQTPGRTMRRKVLKRCFAKQERWSEYTGSKPLAPSFNQWQ